jgi:tetratricopeptide (TPR) repeat protein
MIIASSIHFNEKIKNRMKKINLNSVKVVVLTFSLTLFLFSCGDDFLNIPPELSIPEDNVFDTPDRILAQVNGLYLSARHGRLFGGRYYIYNDIRAEEFRNRTSNGVTGYSAYGYTNDAGDTYVTDFWNHGYLTINRVNKFLADFDQHPGVVSEALEQNYRGEAKFIRALAYYALVQLFAKPYALDQGESQGIPLRLTPQTNTENNELASSPVKDIYVQILKDLDDAETGLPNTYSTALLRTTRAHKNTAIALKTRIYLAQGNYDKVLEESDKIVAQDAPFVSPNGDRAPHALQPDITTVFASPYTTSENILSFAFSDTNVPGTQNQLGYYYGVNGNIEYFLNQSAPGVYADERWGANDARRTSLTAVYSAAWHILTKWNSSSPYLDYAPAIRYAEVLLNAAEAEAEAGDPGRARELLEAVRHRSDPDYDFGTFDTEEELIEAILFERRVELLGEGFRSPDLQRRASPVFSVGANATIPPTDDRYVFPIPVTELQTNPLVR